MMCAFMTPILRDDWEIYPSGGKRSRNISGSSQKTNSKLVPRSKSDEHRRRALGEQRSMSYHAGPTRNDSDLSYVRGQPRAYHLSVKNSRNSSSTSFSQVMPDSATPPSGGSGMSSRKKQQSSTSLNKFHNRVIDKLKDVLHIKDPEKQNQEEENTESEETTKS